MAQFNFRSLNYVITTYSTGCWWPGAGCCTLYKCVTFDLQLIKVGELVMQFLALEEQRNFF